MRTTLDIDDDVLRAAKELAATRNISAGKMLSELARRSLIGERGRKGGVRGGFRLLPAGGKPVTAADVKALLDED
jgi:hypothetical protein